MTEDASIWFIHAVDGQQGPFTTDELREKRASGEIGAEALVWKDGQAEWLPLEQALPPLPPKPAPPETASAPASPQPNVVITAPTRGGNKKWIGASVAVLLLAGLAAAGYFGYRWYQENYGAPLDFATIMPDGALLFAESCAGGFDEAGNQLFKEWFTFMKEQSKSDLALPQPGQLDYRMGMAIYYSGDQPAFVVALAWKDPKAAGDFEKKVLANLGLDKGKEREERGWKILENDGKRYLAVARKGKYRIVATSKAKLTEVLELYAGEKKPSLAANANFSAAFAGAAPGADRSYVDVVGIVKVAAPLFLLLGEDGARIKKDYLDRFKYIATVGTSEAGCYRSTVQVALDNGEKVFGGWKGRKLAWPLSAEKKGQHISFSFVPPPGWEKLAIELVKRAGGDAESRLTAVEAKMAMANVSLSMYSAENNGKFPRSPVFTALLELESGILGNYTPTKDPSFTSLCYQGEDTGYVLAFVTAGETVCVYSSQTGKIERTPQAVEIMGRTLPDFEAMEKLLAKVEEIAVEAGMPDGLLSATACAAVRMSEPEFATRLESTVLSVAPTPPSTPFRLSGSWMVFGTGAGLDAVIARLDKPGKERDAIFSMQMHIATRDVKDIPIKMPPLELSVDLTARYAGNAITMECTVKPDPRPISHAVSLIQWTQPMPGGLFGFPGMPGLGGMKRPAGPPAATDDAAAAEKPGED